jgi:prepilin-type N-terminal cleavage/methylation domain-containing protein
MRGATTQPGASRRGRDTVIPALRQAQGRPSAGTTRTASGAGFSLLELMISVAIILLLMSAVFPFIAQSQKTFQGNQATAEANQTARAGLEVITQEIGQAGYNPNFNNARSSTVPVTASASPQCVGLNSVAKISPGDWLYVDTGPNEELVQVLSTSTTPGSPCNLSNQIQAIFSYNHAPTLPATTYPFISYKMPYGVGIIQGSGTSTDRRLEFFGDMNQDGVIRYVVYSLNPVSPASTVTINGTVYTLYNLYRSITPVTFGNLPPNPAPSGPSVNNPASVLVSNVLYNSTNASGPSGQPIFAYPNQVTIGVIPNVITVVGTIIITLSVDVAPLNLATGQAQWTTMATQIRPINLAAAVAVNNAGGAAYLPPLPKTLPMANTSNYYQ